jgi:heme/copper-type cytochrome/quinol oxidase subunit 4
VPIIFLIAIEFPSNRTTMNIKALSFVDILFSLVLLFIFNSSESNQQAFIIANLFLIIIYLGIIYMISQMSK